jgi:hypothetical protein
MRHSLLITVILAACCAISPDLAQAPSAGKSEKSGSMGTKSAWTWGYFFASNERSAVESLFGENKPSLTRYRVDKVVPVTGEAGVVLEVGSTSSARRLRLS